MLPVVVAWCRRASLGQFLKPDIARLHAAIETRKACMVRGTGPFRRPCRSTQYGKLAHRRYEVIVRMPGARQFEQRKPLQWGERGPLFARGGRDAKIARPNTYSLRHNGSVSPGR